MAQARRLFFHYSEFPLSMRTLFTGTLVVLGIGYAFAMLHIYYSHAGRDGKPGLSVRDLAIAYSGSQEDTRLEVALKGPMTGMLPGDEKNVIIAWVQRGAHEEDFDVTARPIIDARCLACHDGSNPHIPNLDGFANVSEFTEKDTGEDIFTLVRVSHIHLFGITFIFFIMGFIFSHAHVRPLWFKSAVIVVPFIAILADVGSWYVTKLYPPFAWVVMGGGALMGASFACMWLVSMYQIWFSQAPREAARRQAPIL